MEYRSLYDISWKVSEEVYRKDSAYSYSTIARFDREGFSNLDKLFEPLETPSLVFGNVVDTLLTGHPKEFEEKYVVTKLPKISDTLVEITRILFNRFGDTYIDIKVIPDEILSQVGKDCDYYANTKFEKHRIKTIKENCEVYYNTLQLSKGKTVISEEEYMNALKCVDALKNNEYTKQYFSKPNPFQNVEKLYQVKFKGSYLDYTLRCMCDLLIVDHDNKVIIPCDLKTTYNKEWEFAESFVKWRYYIQAQLYWYLIRQNLDKDEQFKEYVLADYRFIVISKYSTSPMIWSYPDTKAEVDVIYGDLNKKLCKNWRNILPDLDYYLKHPSSQYPRWVECINNIKTVLNND